jgi:antitoxin component of MazEF toxin-antitoxin module
MCSIMSQMEYCCHEGRDVWLENNSKQTCYNIVITSYLGIMVKALTKVGNSKAVIIPKQMIVKFKLGRTVMIEETEEGILIKAVQKETSFQKKLRKLRENKEEVYRRIREQVNDPKTKAWYANPENNFGDVHVDIVD